MNDGNIIQAAYEDTVRRAYHSFFEAYTNARGNKGEEQIAEEHFQRAISHARHIRSVALSLVPEVGLAHAPSTA